MNASITPNNSKHSRDEEERNPQHQSENPINPNGYQRSNQTQQTQRAQLVNARRTPPRKKNHQPQTPKHTSNATLPAIPFITKPRARKRARINHQREQKSASNRRAKHTRARASYLAARAARDRSPRPSVPRERARQLPDD